MFVKKRHLICGNTLVKKNIGRFEITGFRQSEYDVDVLIVFILFYEYQNVET